MGLQKDKGLGNKPIIVVLGLIASCIAIFTFITGRQSIPEVLGTRLFIPSQNPPSIAHSSTEEASTPTAMPQPTESAALVLKGPTSIPQVVEFDNPAVSITVTDSGDTRKQGNVHFQFSAGDTPLRNVALLFASATQDITGRWTAADAIGQIYKSNPDGVINVLLAPGDYAALNMDGSAYNQLMGAWGIQASSSDGLPTEMIVFPVVVGKTTDIVVSLARLEIGLISTQGDALKGKAAKIDCQGTDIAGKKVPSGRCEVYQKTDITGVATFNLGPGTYMVLIDNWPRDGVYFYDIFLEAGQVRREILKIPQ